MLLRTVSLNRIVSCVTLPICSRRDRVETSRRSCPSIRISPEVTSKNRGIRFTSVDLPAPLGPTSATISPLWIVMSMPSSICLSPSSVEPSSVEYEKHTFSSSIRSLKLRSVCARGFSGSSSAASIKRKISLEAPSAC